MKNTTKIVGAIALTSITFSVNADRLTVSGDIVGRDLHIFGAGWAGHVGMVTGDPVGGTSFLIIEAMNVPRPAIVLNNLAFFKTQSPYWGSRYGIGTPQQLYHVLREMNFQRWWEPDYSYTSEYRIGSGDKNTGQIFVHGSWRCDTIVAWSFYNNGFFQFNPDMSMIMPRTIFGLFPYFNNMFTGYNDNTLPPVLPKVDKDFSDLTPEELNNMPFEEFQMVADIPLKYTTPSHIAQEWAFANNPHVNNYKRSVFIDRLALSNEPDVLRRFIQMYEETNDDEIKDRLVRGTFYYFQDHRKQIQESSDKELLSNFYKKILATKRAGAADALAVSGFIKLHSTKEILENRNLIDNKMKTMNHHDVMHSALEMSHKSKKLEAIYFPPMIEMLKKDNDSNLNEIFFGLNQTGWKYFHNKETVTLIRDFVNFTASKYEHPTFADQNDPYFFPAKQTYTAIKNNLDKEFSK